MATRYAHQLDELAEALQEARLPRVDDVYLGRTHEVRWRISEGRISTRRVVRTEGIAVRRGGLLDTADGLDRATLAGLLGVSPGTLPPLLPPPFPPLPDPAVLVPDAPPDAHVVWRASEAAVLRPGSATVARRPALVEISCDGESHLGVATSPPAVDAAPRGRGTPRSPAGRILLAPAAAAALLHELVGHPLEADLILAGRSPWSGRVGQTVLSLPLDVDDDPTDATLPGAFSHDDEGVAATRRPLVRGGVCAGVLADRSTAAAVGAAPGNARRASFHAPPAPRLSNLVVPGSDDDPDALRRDASMEITSVSAGTVGGSSGVVRLAVRSAVSLRRGTPDVRLAPFVLQGAFSAVALGLLGVAGPARVATRPGWCGKGGELVPTGGRTPWLLVQGLEVVA